MEKNPVQSVLMKTVGEVKAAEEKYDNIISASKEEADKIMRNARERISEERAKMEEEITAYKNGRLKEGRGSIERDVEKILEKARHEGEGIKKKKMDEKKLLPLAVKLLE